LSEEKERGLTIKTWIEKGGVRAAHPTGTGLPRLERYARTVSSIKINIDRNSQKHMTHNGTRHRKNKNRRWRMVKKTRRPPPPKRAKNLTRKKGENKHGEP